MTPLTPSDAPVTAKGFEKNSGSISPYALVTVAVNVRLLRRRSGTDHHHHYSGRPSSTLGAVMDDQMYSSLPLLMGAGGNADQRRASGLPRV